MHLAGVTMKSAISGDCLCPRLTLASDPGRPSLLVWDLGPENPGPSRLTFDDRAFCVTYADVRADFVSESVNHDHDLIIMRHALFRAAGDTVKALRRAGCRTPLIVLSEEKHRAE
jgi:hypothetical protein